MNKFFQSGLNAPRAAGLGVALAFAFAAAVGATEPGQRLERIEAELQALGAEAAALRTEMNERLGRLEASHVDMGNAAFPPDPRPRGRRRRSCAL